MDGEAVRALAESLGCEAEVVAVTVDRDRPSLEEAARDARYEALERAADEHRAPTVLLGHTASDQAETVVMRVLRGAGVVGIAAMPLRRGRYVRPLLTVSRAEIEAHARQRGLSPVHDSTNQDPRFLRNRVRNQLLPILRRENPKIEDALCRLAAAATEQREILDFAADRLGSSAQAGATGRKCNGPATDVCVAIAPFMAAPPAVAKRALALLAERAGGEPLEARHQEALLDMLGWEQRGTVTLDLPGMRAVREYDRLRLVSASAPARSAPPAISVRGDQGPYEIRPWRPGDRMRPARLKGRSRKLSDLFTDARVPREQRENALVVVRSRDGVIIWAQHIGLAHEVPENVTLTT